MATTREYCQTVEELVAKAAELAAAIGGENAYKVDRLIQSYQSMFDRFCPFEVGSRVKLTKTPTGWLGRGHFLVADAVATVAFADYYGDLFRFQLCFDAESWFGQDGLVHFVDPNRRGLFLFAEDFISSVDFDTVCPIAARLGAT